jgi:Protein kinase domain
MSPEIMDNKRYNSKTDIWSLGCILYEIMCLRLPFEGNCMQELSKNIQTGNGGVICSSLHFSQPLQDLVRDMLLRNSTLRPGINAILSRPVVKACISTFLDASVKCKEFSHTVIHGMNILSVEPSVSKLSGLSGRRDTENYSDETKRGSGKGMEEIRVEQGDSRERGLREQEKQEVQKMIKNRDEAKSPLGPQDRRAPSAFKYDQAVVRVKQPLQQDPNADVAKKERPGYSGEEILLRARKAEVKAENEEAFALASRQALERKRAYEKEAIRLMRRGDGQEKERKQSPMRVERVENVAKEKGKENSSIDLPIVDEKISASIRFEKERMDRQRKLVKKADANAKIVFQRQQDMLYQAPPRAPQQSPSPSPSPTPRPSPSLSPTPPVPSQEIVNGGRAEMKVLPRKVSHVSPVRDSYKPSTAAAGADIEMKSSSVETADILQINMPSRKVAQNHESQIQDPKNMVWKEEFRGIADGHHVPGKQAVVSEDETVEAGECDDVVSPFIFSGHAMPWRHEDPTQPWGNILEGEAPSEACVAAAVEYSELFSQMQDILEHSSAPRPQGKNSSKKDQNKQADQGPSRHQLYDCDGGESDDTFGDEDEGCYDDANGQI